MTYNQLKDEVTALGFESDIEDEDALILAINRALGMIYTDRPRQKRAALYLRDNGEMLLFARMEIEAGALQTVKLSGMAYSFTVSGKGEYRVTDSSGVASVEFDTDGETYRGFISGGGEITFTGSLPFTVYGLCVYYSLSSDRQEDIPAYEDKRTVRVTEKIKDFRAFAQLPEDDSGRTIQSATLNGECLYLPKDFSGRIHLSYYCAPERHTARGDAKIDVTREMEPLLPLLTASFLWLDDDADKAQYYMALYREALAGILRYSKSGISNEYHTNGWA